MYFSVNPCFTLNLKISISCSLVLYNVVNLAFWSSVWYVFEVLLNTVLKAFSCSLSSFRQSDAREKCHTNWQYIRWGIIADLYSCNFAQDGIRFFNLFKIPTCLLTVLHTSLVWRLKFNFSSRFTPSILIDRDCSICSPPKVMLIILSVSPCRSMLWNLSQFTYSRLSAYHLVILSPSSRSSFSTPLLESSAT